MTNIDKRLESIVARIVRLEEEKRTLAEDIKEIYSEAKNAGDDIPALRIVVKRKMEGDDKRTKRERAEALADSMMQAIGMLGDTPLGRAAIERARVQ